MLVIGELKTWGPTERHGASGLAFCSTKGLVF